jgi:hypothetical protein
MSVFNTIPWHVLSHLVRGSEADNRALVARTCLGAVLEVVRGDDFVFRVVISSNQLQRAKALMPSQCDVELG